MATLTPSNPRISATPWSLRLTPSNSPFSKASASKSNKPSRTDAGLSLRHVIGTTANSANAIDTLSSSNSLAFTAGAAAVIATFEDDLTFSQRFYRARPTAIPLNPSPTIYEPSTPTNTPSDNRRRTVALRDAGAGGSPFSISSASDIIDSPGGKSWTARERVKAATCVSFSQDGKYLAVGETGYRPRVLVFSTSTESSPYTPLTSLCDHTFGVKCIAFSPNSQYLASLGTANDGYLYIWNINNRNGAATLYASNKCTSNIYQMAWIGTNLVTVGTRHVKVWRTTDSSGPSTPIKLLASFFPHQGTKTCHKILSGRNCLLGPLLEGTFTAIVSVSSCKAIICSESGDICLLDDSDSDQKFTKIADAGFSVTAASIGPNNAVLLAGKGGIVKTLELESLLRSPNVEAVEPSSWSSDLQNTEAPFIVALAPLGDRTVSIDTSRFIKLIQTSPSASVAPPEVALQLPAHGGSVLGVRPFHGSVSLSASFFTWSADGTVLFWDTDGACKHTITVELEQPDSADEVALNELKVVRLCTNASALVTGDKFGVLRFIDQQSGNCQSSLRAHAGEITDIAVFEQDGVFVASAGRDRTVQVFQQNGGTWDLLQTLDEHVGAVTGLLFTFNGQQLISCSTDRTVVVREALSRTESGQQLTAFVIVRTITLKATPISMALPPDRDDLLLVSAIDRNVHKYNLHNGHVSDSFKVSDSDGGDAVVLSSLAHVPTYNGQSMIAGVSSTDKSIRLYDETGTLLGRDWGHTEGVTDLTVITSDGDGKVSSKSTSLVTVAADGTVFIWSFGTRSNSKHDISRSMELVGAATTSKDLTVNKPPLRRVLSQSEMARFQQKSPGEEMTPTGKARPPLQKRTSRFSLAQVPRLEPSPMSTYDPTGRRKGTRTKSPSPPTSPRSQRVVYRKPSLPNLSTRTRSKPSGVPESIPLATSTDQICRSLRVYRKKITNSTDNLSPETLRELERELGLTARAVGEKAMKARGAADETVMAKLLSQYSERLLEMLDEKFAATLATQLNPSNEDSEGGIPDAIDGARLEDSALSSIDDSVRIQEVEE